MTIRAGDLDTRITIQKRSTTQDASGEPAFTWNTHAIRWGGIERAGGREIYASAQREGIVPTVIRMRYLSGVLPSMRVVAAGHVYDIKSVVRPGGRSGEMLLVCEELVEVSP